MVKDPSELKPGSTNAPGARPVSVLPSSATQEIRDRLASIEHRLSTIEKDRRQSLDDARKIKYIRIAAACSLGASLTIAASLAIFKLAWNALRSGFVDLSGRGL